MNTSRLLERAISIAAEAHANTTDRYGEPYILHPLRVMQAGKTPEERICGILHDVIEDSDWTLEMLRKEGFPDHIVHAVDCLTKRDSEPYQDYIDRVKTNSLAIKVKLSDLTDNMDIKRAPALQPEDLDRLNKYLKAWHELKHLLP